MNQIKDVKAHIKLYEEYRSQVNDDSDPREVLFYQTKLNPYFEYLAFNTNTMETLQSTGDIKLIPTEIRIPEI